MQIQLSDHFTYGRLLRFTVPSILMMLFTTVYGMVDGIFISNYVGTTAFASVNLILPFLQILGGVGAMLGVGGSAQVAKTLGEGKIEKAQRQFTMMVILMVITGIGFTVLGIVVLRPVAYLFGATDNMIGDIMLYGTICLLFNTVHQAQYTFQRYLIVAEKPKFALAVVTAAGISNMVLDFLFMAVFRMGIAGAALATGISQCIGGITPLLWFISRKNTSALRFRKTKLERKPLVQACFNGSSEMLSSVSGSITGILYNYQLMKYAGENGVAAYGVVMYAAYIFLSVFAGYSQGSCPIMGFQYGAQNHTEVKNVLKKSLIFLGGSSVTLTALAVLFARPISSVFVGYDPELLALTTRAFTICALPFLIMWFSIFSSAFFTALNDGAVSAEISFMRTLVFPVICILIMPAIWKLDGVWYSLVSSEILSVSISLYFLRSKEKVYQY